MAKTIDYRIMDPEGNITILVATPTDRAAYQPVALALLKAHPEAEQVGFVVSDGEVGDRLPRMEMSGLEFCGNATRAFAFYEASRCDPFLPEIDVEVSGCDHPLHAWIDRKDASNASVRIQMPVPQESETIHITFPQDQAKALGTEQIQGELVHMDGISHLVISEIPWESITACERDTMEGIFRYIRDTVYGNVTRDMPAFGTMFADPARGQMKPIVYVRDVDTIYFEGSCASGSNAAAYAMAMGKLQEAEKQTYTLQQPAGTLRVDVFAEKAGAGGPRIRQMQLYGNVGISPLRQMTIED